VTLAGQRAMMRHPEPYKTNGRRTMVMRPQWIGGVLALLCSACATAPDAVPPSQGGYLTRPEMAFERGLVGESAIRDKTFVSKEAAAGGPGLGAGGCGCN
jgi:hypothetical protein